MTDTQPETALQQAKQTLLSENNHLAELFQTQRKNAATIQALQTELSDLAQAAKMKLAEPSALGIDDFVKFRTNESELKAKIDYFTLANEEIEIQLEEQREKVFLLSKEYREQRNEVIFEKGKQLLNEFAEAHKTELNEILQLLEYSGKLSESDPIYGKDIDHRPQFIFKALHNAANFENSEIFAPYLLPELALNSDYQPKTVTKKHADSFNQQPKGFQRLIQEMNQ